MDRRVAAGSGPVLYSRTVQERERVGSGLGLGLGLGLGWPAGRQLIVTQIWVWLVAGGGCCPTPGLWRWQGTYL